jgi:hypothetical protein
MKGRTLIQTLQRGFFGKRKIQATDVVKPQKVVDKVIETPAAV